jgi:hypothetical protein
LNGGRAYFVGEIGETDGSEGVGEIGVFSSSWVERLHPVQGRGITEHVTTNEDLFGSVFDGNSEAGRPFQVKGFSDDFWGLVSEGKTLRVVIAWAREVGSDTLPAGVFLLVTLN